MRRGHIVYSRVDWKRRDSGQTTAEINIDVEGLDQLESAKLHAEVEALIKERLTA